MPSSRCRSNDSYKDLELTRAWVYVSTDAAISVDQTVELFWTRVKLAMENSDAIASAVQAGTYESRPWKSLKTHCGEVSKKISKLVRCVKKFESLQQSGTTERDALLKAQELYQEENKSSFQYHACYVVWSQCPKFQQLLVVSKKRNSSEVAMDAEASTADSLMPPTPARVAPEDANGVKAAKRKRGVEILQARAVKAQEQLSASMASKTEIAATRLRIQEEQTLQSMLNALYAVEPRNTEHAAFLQMRRGSLLSRLKTFDYAGHRSPISGNLRISELCSSEQEKSETFTL